MRKKLTAIGFFDSGSRSEATGMYLRYIRIANRATTHSQKI
ncbi:MAG: hypothetical protein RLY40_817 [Pseudomonadota bacterium]|jgi:hypothetical protein